MKHANLLITAAIVLTGFASCNTATKEAKQDAENLQVYVDSIEGLAPVYTTSNWSKLEDGYQERLLKIEKTNTALEDADKKKVDASKAKYATLKANYEANEQKQKMAAAALDYRQILRTRLFGEGKIGADMKFDFVTAKNILSVYENFVDIVAENKKNYTREDWDEIKVLYEALDTRKNAVEKDLASADNMKIAGLKIRFASINTTHRPTSKGEENEAAKKG